MWLSQEWIGKIPTLSSSHSHPESMVILTKVFLLFNVVEHQDEGSQTNVTIEQFKFCIKKEIYVSIRNISLVKLQLLFFSTFPTFKA